ncbi:MAG TPA: GNAT family N-acetyltransferase [Acidimicrobiales bacterium]
MEDDRRVVDLDASHADLLRSFSCRRLGEPWTVVIDEAICRHVAPHLGRRLHGVGLVVDDRLCGVAVWRTPPTQGAPPPPATWEICYLATHTSHARRGYARHLKIEVLRRARAAGIKQVISYVDWDNQAMLSLNEKLGARRARIPCDDRYALCVCLVDECLRRLGL